MEPKQIFIGICGFKQSGKDTAAQFIREHLGLYFDYYKLPFALPIKKEICRRHGITMAALEADKERYRKDLQNFGEEEKKRRGKTVWLDETLKELEKTLNKNKNQLFIFPDVRFPFEAEAIKERGGFIVKIERFDDTEDTHTSETSIKKIRSPDYYLPNRGTLADLKRECLWLSQIIRLRYQLV